jgi:hypothetical protein
MKRKNKVMLFGCALGLTAVAGFSSCTDGYEETPVEKFSIDYVYSTTDSLGSQARYTLNNIYRIFLSQGTNYVGGTNRVNGDFLDAASDDAISLYYDESQVYRLAMGQFTARNLVTAEMSWGTYYTVIRQASEFVNNIDRVPFNLTYTKYDGTKAPLNGTLKAEARFLRALAYFELTKRYGGVPLMGDKVYTLDDDLELPRNTYAECIDYIVSELDAIKDDLRGLPMSSDEYASYAVVPTRDACMALKARVLLYAASPLFNEKPIEQGNELVGYASYDVNRWKKAADAAYDFIIESGHKGSGAVGLCSNFRNVFLSYYSVNANPELIWYTTEDLGGTSVEKNNGPLGFTGNALGNGRTLPTQNLVESFPMKDGYMPGESPKYSYSFSDQYSNRDPRMEMTILHNGSNWLGTQLQTYQQGANNPSSSSRYTRTSYYMCKMMADYSSGTKEYSGVTRPWVVLRYAEVLLNYAEALNEYLASPSSDVYDCLIMLRKRAGIEAGTNNMYGLKENMTREEMREVIHNERRIEMAFEEQRYYDIRRWREAENVFATPLRGLTITNRDGVMNYAENEVLNVTWNNRRYLYPIPYNEVSKNANMKQNPNW